jgi:SprT protein
MTDILSARRQSLVRVATRQYIQRAQELYQREFEVIPVQFDLKGRSAGMFRARGTQCCIRYNPWIFSRYFEENLVGTVPHEVAHYIAHCLNPHRRIRPHGPQWRAVMAGFEADASVTCDFDLQDIPQRRERRFSYHCGCREHQISTRRHNAVLRGQNRYECRYCRGRLVESVAVISQEQPSDP